MQRRPGILLIILLSLGCAFFGSQDKVQPVQVPTRIPTTIPTGAATLPSIPDFEENITLAGFGGGGGWCDRFDVPPSPAVVGGTTFSTDNAMMLGGPDYPRSAMLCISGIPKDQWVTIHLVSPGETTELTARIQVVDGQGGLTVLWDGYPENGSIEQLRIYAEQENTGLPIHVELDLWWPTALESGVWQVQVAWSGKTIYGSFYANTRNLPEISLIDLGFDRVLFPATGVSPYTCHVAPAASPYAILAENFPPDSILYILVYHASNTQLNGAALELEYQTAVRTDELGIATADLLHEFRTGEAYVIVGIPKGVTDISSKEDFTNAEVLSFETIADAFDCFIVSSGG